MFRVSERCFAVFDKKMSHIYYYVMALLNIIFPSIKFTFEKEYKEQLLFPEVLVLEIAPISLSSMYSQRILILTNIIRITS